MVGVSAMLEAAEVAGLEVRVEGDRLVVRGPRKAEPVAKQLLDHKAELVTHLSRSPATATAVTRAYEAALARWLNGHPPSNIDPDRCAACDGPVDDRLVILGDGAVIHYSGPHRDACYRTYQTMRRSEAEDALARAGMRPSKCGTAV